MTLLKLNRKLALLLYVLLCTINTSFAVTPSTCFDNTPGNMTNRFTDLGDGTVLDTLTDLIWQRCNLSQTWSTTTESCLSFTKTRNWRDSLLAIQNYNANQFALGLPDSWRMPNIKELSSIMDINCTNYALDVEIFPSPEAVYWSSTPIVSDVYENKNVVGDGVQDENYIWVIKTETGKELLDIPVSNDSISTLLVRNPTTP